MTLKLSTKKENKNWWQMHFKGKKKTQRPYFVLFSFHNIVGWKKQGWNGRKIRGYARSFNNHKRT
jgi:hypothetical protein